MKVRARVRVRVRIIVWVRASPRDARAAGIDPGAAAAAPPVGKGRAHPAGRGQAGGGQCGIRARLEAMRGCYGWRTHYKHDMLKWAL